MNVSTADQEQDVSRAEHRRGRDDVGATPRHVSRRAVPLLPAVRLQVLQVERVPVVQQKRLACPRWHVDRRSWSKPQADDG